MGSKNNAKLPNIEELIRAGIDPRTGLPIRLGGTAGPMLKSNIKSLMAIKDEQDATTRYTWYNLYPGLTGELIERVLYFKGQGALFFVESLKKFFFLPYALDGKIDVYGRFLGITPLPFAGGTADKKDNNIKDENFIPGMHKTPVYEYLLPEELTKEIITDGCVLLHDYMPGLSQTVTPRSMLNAPLVDLISDMPPFLRTKLLNDTGVSGVRVTSEDEQSNVTAASNKVNEAALNGEKWVCLAGPLDFQELTGKSTGSAEEYLMSMQALDNLRLGFLGLENGGLFQKASHILQAEHDTNTGHRGSPLQDGLERRQMLCQISNSIWGGLMWCEISEIASGVDKNLDGELSDRQPGKDATGEEFEPQGGISDDV